MPIAINANKIRVKDAGTSKYLTFDVVADEATEKRIEQIEAKKNNVLASISTVAELEEMIEGAFDSTRDYVVGQYVIQEVNGVNNLYRFNANYAANSGWSSANVVKVSFGDEISDFKQILDSFKSNSLTRINNLEQNVQNISREIEDAAGVDEDGHDMTLGDKFDDLFNYVETGFKNVTIDVDDLGLEQDPDTYIVYPTYKGERSEIGIPLVGGSGGGGGGASSFSYTIRLASTIERTIKVAKGATVTLAFTYTSTDEEGMDDGAGTGTITVNGVKQDTRNIAQGNNLIDVTSYLSSGDNTVRVKVVNSEGSSRIIDYSITVSSLAVSTTMNKIDTYSGNASVFYTVTGAGEKTIHFILDGVEIGTEVTNTSGRSRTYIIPEQAHGSHTLQIYATSESITSNTETLSMIWVNENSSTPIIASDFSANESIMQGTTIAISYRIYDPIQEVTRVTFIVLDANGQQYSKTTIENKDRTTGIWSLSDYPAGNITLRIQSRDTTSFIDFPITVTEYIFPISVVDSDLELEFNAKDRSNGEPNPATWTYGSGANAISATFNNFTWSTRSDASDGWLLDDDNSPILRFLPGNSMTIPYRAFASDFGSTGYTIEVDLATHNVQDYESLVISSYNGGVGFRIASQNARYDSNQEHIVIQFKEDERVRVTFVIESRTANRLIYTYINGIMCGAIQYNTDDSFSQASPVGITIGAETCGLDLYSIRCYKKYLNYNEQLDNFICDQSTLAARQKLYADNNILNDDGEISVNKLPATLPYMILSCAQLPTYKGDKKEHCTVIFVDPSNTNKSFTAYDVTLDVQGTSSQYYEVKNEKVKVAGGFEVNGEIQSKYALKDGEIPIKSFCLKVDYASSENANNVMLVELYEQIAREFGYLTPPQKTDSRVRQGISGRPIALFWQNSNTNEITFVGKANFNNDKGTEETFGFTDAYPNAESWEFRNNTSPSVLFQSIDFDPTHTALNDKGETVMAWQNDFEARYPEDNTNTDQFKRVMQFVVDHNWDNASVKSTYGTKEAMLAHFKANFENYFLLDLILFYYIFTSQFLMIDSRAKNMFLTTYDGTHWLPLPYDFDTALGINNEGKLEFGYSLTDTDSFNGGDVFNGQKSVLWNNVREAYASEIRQMYVNLRSTDSKYFNYDYIAEMFRKHQEVWPERMWNIDGITKYIYPTLYKNDDQLEKLQGDKTSQREWWLYNTFKFWDSYYNTGDAYANNIEFRCWSDSTHPFSEQNITVVPYSDIVATVDYADRAYTKQQRLERNNSFTFTPPDEIVNFNDTGIHILSADRLKSVGDLSPMNIGSANFSAANKLQELIIGSAAAGYENNHLSSLSVGNNELLKILNVCNCKVLNTSIDLSGCKSLETVLATGSTITGVSLPKGGHLKKLDLPATTASVSIQDQKYFQSLSLEGLSSLTRLFVENTPNVDVETLINTSPLTSDNIPTLHQIRLFGIEWTATSEAALTKTIDRLDEAIGLDNNGIAIDTITVNGETTAVTKGTAVVNGKVHISEISSTLLTRIQTTYPDLIVVVNNVPQYLASYYNYDKTLLYRAVLPDGGNAIDPVTTGAINAPERPDEDGMSYVYIGWDLLPTNVHSNVTINASYKTTCRVRFINKYGTTETVMQTLYVDQGNGATYTGSTPTKPQDQQYTYTFSGWDKSTTNVTAAMDVYAQYTGTLRKYTVYWDNSNGSNITSTLNVTYGTTTSKPANPTHPTDPENFKFIGWSPDASATPITGDTHCVAQYLDMRSIVIKYLNRTIDEYESTTATKVGTRAFDSITALKTAKTSATTIDTYAFNGCTGLTNVELTSTSPVTINANAFAGCTNMTELIINSTTVSSLSATSALPGSFNGRNNGIIYVTDSLVDSYKAATNWSTFATHIYGKSQYPVTPDFSTVSDTWAQIIAASNDGTYATKYNVGDIKQMTDSDGKTFYMELVAKDTDNLADGSGTANMTWLCTDLYDTHNMNSSLTNANGWEATAMRTYLTSTVLPKLTDVKDSVKEVTKTWYDYTSKTTKSSVDKIWIPSTYEMFSDATSSIVEDSGVQYTKFNSAAKRIKYNKSGSAAAYWLRSAFTSSSPYFYIVTNGGNCNSSGATVSYGVVFGFCL